MIRFTYKARLNERVSAKCIRHPRYNPQKDGRGGIHGGCSGCFALLTCTNRVSLWKLQRSSSNDLQRRGFAFDSPASTSPRPPALGTRPTRRSPSDHKQKAFCLLTSVPNCPMVTLPTTRDYHHDHPEHIRSSHSRRRPAVFRLCHLVAHWHCDLWHAGAV